MDASASPPGEEVPPFGHRLPTGEKSSGACRRLSGQIAKVIMSTTVDRNPLRLSVVT